MNFTIRWELLKQGKKKALEISCALKKDGKREEALLRSSLGVCVKKECKPPGSFKDDIRTLKAQLAELR